MMTTSRCFRTRLLTLAALVLCGPSGCTLHMMNKMMKPKPVQPPVAKQFPEGERAFSHSTIKWRPPGQLRRAFMMHGGWEMRPDESSRYVGVLMYFHEPTTDKLGLYKGAEGETGACYEYDCWVYEERLGSTFGPPILECNQDTLKKVTCASVEALPDGLPVG